MKSASRSSFHAQWHRRVEGQIRDLMYQHPRWFSGIPNDEMPSFIESMSKRIVGEIVAAAKLATMPNSVAENCANSAENEDGARLSSSVVVNGCQHVPTTEIPNQP